MCHIFFKGKLVVENAKLWVTDVMWYKTWVMIRSWTLPKVKFETRTFRVEGNTHLFYSAAHISI